MTVLSGSNADKGEHYKALHCIAFLDVSKIKEKSYPSGITSAPLQSQGRAVHPLWYHTGGLERIFTLVIDAKGESSNTTGINGNQVDNSANDAGAVYLY